MMSREKRGVELQVFQQIIGYTIGFVLAPVSQVVVKE